MAVITTAAAGSLLTPANWVGGVLPTPLDDVWIMHPMTLADGETFSALRIGYGGTSTSKITVAGASTINADLWFSAEGERTMAGAVVFLPTTGGTLTWNGNVTTGPTTDGFTVNHSSLIVNGNVTPGIGNEITGGAIFSMGNGRVTINGHVIGTLVNRSQVWRASSSASSAIVRLNGDMRAGAFNNNGRGGLSIITGDLAGGKISLSSSFGGGVVVGGRIYDANDGSPGITIDGAAFIVMCRGEAFQSETCINMAGGVLMQFGERVITPAGLPPTIWNMPGVEDVTADMPYMEPLGLIGEANNRALTLSTGVFLA